MSNNSTRGTPFDEPINPPTEIVYEFRHIVRGRDFQLCETRGVSNCPHYDHVRRQERFFGLPLWWVDEYQCRAFKRTLEVTQEAQSTLVHRCFECREVDRAMQRQETYDLHLERMKAREHKQDERFGEVRPLVVASHPDLSDAEWKTVRARVAEKRGQ
jgi:hypothetical protein